MLAGKRGLFSGQAALKQAYCFVIPAFVTLYCALALFILRSTKQSFIAVAQFSISTDVATEHHNAIALLKYANYFGMYALVVGGAVFVFYLILYFVGEGYIECKEPYLNVDVSSLYPAVRPYYKTFFGKGENLTQWAYTALSSAYLVTMMIYWGRRSAIANSDRMGHAVRVYNGLRMTVQQMMEQSDVYNCFRQWQTSALGVRGSTTRRKHNLAVVSYWALHIPAGIFLGLPQCAYVIANNVESDNWLTDSLRNSVVVVLWSAFLNLLFERKMTEQMVMMRMRFEAHNQLMYHRACAQTLFLLRFLGDVVLPIVVTVLMDENCWVCHSLCLRHSLWPLCGLCCLLWLVFASAAL